MALLLHAYRIFPVTELSYRFVTDAGAEYNCTFISYADYFKDKPQNIASRFYSFNLDLVNKDIQRKGIDKRIADTVITIVGDFLNSQINAVVYVCDNSDNREAARSRKFLSWFTYTDHPSNEILQIGGAFEAGGMKLYTALLVHRKNKLKKKLVEAYLDLIEYDDEK
jgi:Family of unknown function (DUF6169)